MIDADVLMKKPIKQKKVQKKESAKCSTIEGNKGEKKHSTRAK